MRRPSRESGTALAEMAVRLAGVEQVADHVDARRALRVDGAGRARAGLELERHRGRLPEEATRRPAQGETNRASCELLAREIEIEVRHLLAGLFEADGHGTSRSLCTECDSRHGFSFAQ